MTAPALPDEASDTYAPTKRRDPPTAPILSRKGVMLPWSMIITGCLGSGFGIHTVVDAISPSGLSPEQAARIVRMETQIEAMHTDITDLKAIINQLNAFNRR